MSDINVQTFSGKVNVTNNLLVGSSHLFVDTVGNKVGITTASPDAGLHVNSNAYVNTDFRVGSSIIMNDTAGQITAGSFVGDGSAMTGINSDSGSWVNGTGNVYLSTTTDKVGIGTSDPTDLLHVMGVGPNSSGNFIGINISDNQGSNSSTNLPAIGFSHNGDIFRGGIQMVGTNTNLEKDMIFRVGRDTNIGGFSVHSLNDVPERMRIKRNGNVGVGTSSPEGQLHISSGTSGDCFLILEADTDNSTEGNNPKIVFRQDGGYIEGEIGLDNNYLVYRSVSTSGGHRFYVNDTAVHQKTDYNYLQNNSTRAALTIDEQGNVGIGFTSPGTLGTHTYPGGNSDNAESGRYILHLMGWMYYGDKTGDNETWITGIGTSTSGEPNHFLWRFSLNGASPYNVAYIGYTNGSYVDVKTFTGQHRAARIENIPPKDAHTYEGLIVVADKNAYESVNGEKRRGKEAITTNEAVPFLTLSKKVRDKTCFGVISASEDPDKREQRFGNFVSIHPKEGGDTFIFVNSLGEGAMWVTNVNGALESGDFITTSDVPGYGMKQNDDILHNYTVAKITMDCDFNPPTQPVQRVKKILGEVQYWVETKYIDVTREEYDTLDETERTIEYINSKTLYKRIIKEDSLEKDEKHTELDIRMELVNDVDENGQMIWEDHPTETEKAYKVRYLLPDGTQISEDEYTTRALADEKVYIAAFVGCTYHCG